MSTCPTPKLRLPEPRWLTAALAAAYLGTGREDFLAEVEAGVWPGPARSTTNAGPLWDRKVLDLASDQLSGLDSVAPARAAMDLLTVAEVAALLQCSADTVYRISSEDLPACQPGKVKLYKRDDVLAYASSRQRARPGIAHAQVDAALQRIRKTG